MNSGTCPICGTQVTNEEWMGHFNTGMNPHIHIYEAFCESCQIKLERRAAGDKDTGWYTSSVEHQDIVAELSTEEVEQVEVILAKYPTLLKQWQEFIAQKRKDDRVCRFQENNLEYTGLTIRRGKHLIGRFWVSRNL